MMTYPMHVAGLVRDLPICKVTEDFYIGAFIMFGDAELTVACARDLLKLAEELAQEENLVFLCGHYEGIDERVIEEIVTDEISLGDFVLTGGELAAITIIDAVSRLVPGVLGKEESFEDESFSEGLLEYPQYTRPPVFMGREVPEVLLSGHHGNVAKWRREQALICTAKKRPDLLKKAVLTKQDIAFLQKQGITIEETE